MSKDKEKRKQRVTKWIERIKARPNYGLLVNHEGFPQIKNEPDLQYMIEKKLIKVVRTLPHSSSNKRLTFLRLKSQQYKPI